MVSTSKRSGDTTIRQNNNSMPRRTGYPKSHRRRGNAGIVPRGTIITHRYAERYIVETAKWCHARKKVCTEKLIIEKKIWKARENVLYLCIRVDSMKAIRAKLKEVEKALLQRTSLSQEEYDAYTSELKSLKELIAVKKALASYEQDFGDAIDEDGAPRQKRVSESTWD